MNHRPGRARHGMLPESLMFTVLAGCTLSILIATRQGNCQEAVLPRNQITGAAADGGMTCLTQQPEGLDLAQYALQLSFDLETGCKWHLG